MLLIGAKSSPSAGPAVWNARTLIRTDAAEALHALTDPAMIARWAPVAFEVDGISGGCLRAGSRERVTGTIAGIRASFDVEVSRADTARLELVARGPVTLDVAYSFSDQDLGVLVEASVGLRQQRGLAAQVLRAAVAALLGAGGLSSALGRLEASLCQTPQPELLAA